MTKFSFQSADEVLSGSTKGYLMTIYGEPGSGKSSFALTATKCGKVAFVDAEKKIGKISGDVIDGQFVAENLFGIEGVKTISDLNEMANDPETIRELVNNYEYLVIDSLTDLVDAYLMKVKRTGRSKLTFDDWGEIANSFMLFIDTVRDRGMKVIMTVHESHDDKREMYVPKTEGKAVAARIERTSDYLFYIEKDANDQSERHLRTSATDSKKDFVTKKNCKSLPDTLSGEDICLEGVENLLPKPPVEKKITAKEVKVLEALVEEGDKLAPLNMAGLFDASSIKEKEFAELTKREYKKITEELVARNDRRKEEQKIQKKAK